MITKSVSRILLAVTSLICSFDTYSAETNPGSGEMWANFSYEIISSERDATLNLQHSIFEFHLDTSLVIQNGGSPLQLEYSCNGAIQYFTVNSNALIVPVVVSPGTFRFQFLISGDYYEITTDSIPIHPGFRTHINLHFSKIVEQPNNPIRVIAYKPVLYFYSQKDMPVSVSLKPRGEFTFTYPEYKNGWKGTAHSDGSVTIDKTRYPYLFWEGSDLNIASLADYSTGFIVEKHNMVTFLEQQLTTMGFNDKEKTDFITFWGPRMTQTDQGFVQFLFTEDYSRIAELNVEPEPDHLFRVYMLYTPLPENHGLRPQPQHLSTMNRSGFYVLEWGGSELVWHNSIIANP